MSPETSPGPGLMRRVSRRVVPGLPRAKTFKRQQSEVREKLEPIAPSPDERRAVSVDRRAHPLRNISRLRDQQLPRASAPDFLDDTRSTTTADLTLSVPPNPLEEKHFLNVSTVSHTSTANTEAPPEEAKPLRLAQPLHLPSRDVSTAGARSTTTSLYDAQINKELESKWILNLSMHFRDKSKREKFFVTYRENDSLWRRVTISLDYRGALDDSLEKDLLETKFQREKSAKIYEAIRESLNDIQFYSTVTNLKLQTTDGRLHVHVVEDVSVSTAFVGRRSRALGGVTSAWLTRSSRRSFTIRPRVWCTISGVDVSRKAPLNSTRTCRGLCTRSAWAARPS